MKLVVWNCRMALHERRKWHALAALQPDLAVVPEAANPRQPMCADLLKATRSNVWVGPNENKGLAAMSFGSYALVPLPRLADERHDALAVRVVGPGGFNFILVAVWARAPKYVEHLHDVLDTYEPLLRAHDVVLAGDFNSNSLWDRRHGKKNHTRLVARLHEFGLESAYHVTRTEAHGAETEKTYQASGPDRRQYHIDYVFLPRSWRPRLLGCGFGDAPTWFQLSDHRPMLVELADDLPGLVRDRRMPTGRLS